MWKQYLLGIIISLAAGGVFFYVVDWGAMAQAFKSIRWIFLLPCAGFYLLAYLLRAQRWHYLMRPVARVSFGPLFSALTLGFFANNILPAHLGEFVRAYILGRSENISKAAVFATIVTERIYDGLTLLFLLMLTLFYMDPPPIASQTGFFTTEMLHAAAWSGLALFVGLLVFMQLLRWQEKRVSNWLAKLMRPLPQTWSKPALGLVAGFAQGLKSTKGKDLAGVIIYSLASWLCLSAWAWSLFPAFGLKLGLEAGVMLEAVMALALLIPAAPAYIGTFHLAAVFTLDYLGSDSGVAGSYAMLLWFIHLVGSMGLGFIVMAKQGLSFKTIRDKNH